MHQVQRPRITSSHRAPLALPGLVLADLSQSIFSGFWSAFLVFAGFAVLVFGAFAVVQTQRWPSAASARSTRPQPAPSAPAPAPGPSGPALAQPVGPPVATMRPVAQGDVQIRFPQIADAHPDVWSTDTPLHVVVEVGDPGQAEALQVILERHRNGDVERIDERTLDEDGPARFEVPFPRIGEDDLVVQVHQGDHLVGQAVRGVRVVDYRTEIIETFEDFLAWASTQFDFVDARRTAREFVDRFVDGRPGTPHEPLESIADLYEVANYSEHDVDRATYLALVDAFLVLEEAGALEGPEEAA